MFDESVISRRTVPSCRAAKCPFAIVKFHIPFANAVPISRCTIFTSALFYLDTFLLLHVFAEYFSYLYNSYVISNMNDSGTMTESEKNETELECSVRIGAYRVVAFTFRDTEKMKRMRGNNRFVPHISFVLK